MTNYDPASSAEMHEAAERLEDAGNEEYAGKLRARAEVRLSRPKRWFGYLKAGLMWFVTIAGIALGIGGTAYLAYEGNILGAVVVLFVCLIILLIVTILAIGNEAIYDAIAEQRREELAG